MLVGYMCVSKANGSQVLDLQHDALITAGAEPELRLAQAVMGQAGTKMGEPCVELGITRQTLYRHVEAKGVLRPDWTRLLKGRIRPTMLQMETAP